MFDILFTMIMDVVYKKSCVTKDMGNQNGLIELNVISIIACIH